MKLIILSGGSGKRLWPLSNESRSKQFLRIIGDLGERKSMIQHLWRQLEKNRFADSAYIATRRSQVEMIRSQIGDVNIIIEPDRRDTFPAIALAAVYLYSVENVDPEEPVVVLPVDCYVEDRFFDTVRELEKAIRLPGVDLALIGVSPDRPSDNYGYIIPRRSGTEDEHIFERGGIFWVEEFREKPSLEVAKRLIADQALWNCGVFAFKLGFLLSLLKKRGYPTSYEHLMNRYADLPKNSFDYEVVERCKNIVAVAYHGYWSDMGTWSTITEKMSANVVGKGVVSGDCSNTHLINELDIPIMVIGISDAVVAASPDGILVANKAASSKVKSMLGDVVSRPMYEERRWGWYRVLDYVKYGDAHEALTRRVCIHAQKNLSYQTHRLRTEQWTVLKGEAEAVLDGRLIRLSAGDVLEIPNGVPHALRALTDFEFIEVQNGKEVTEHDVERLFLDWEDIVKFAVKTDDPVKDQITNT